MWIFVKVQSDIKALSLLFGRNHACAWPMLLGPWFWWSSFNMNSLSCTKNFSPRLQSSCWKCSTVDYERNSTCTSSYAKVEAPCAYEWNECNSLRNTLFRSRTLLLVDMYLKLRFQRVLQWTRVTWKHAIMSTTHLNCKRITGRKHRITPHFDTAGSCDFVLVPAQHVCVCVHVRENLWELSCACQRNVFRHHS